MLMKAEGREGMPRHTLITDQETRGGSTYTVHLAQNFVKCWCLPLTKGVQNSKNHAKNKILLEKNSNLWILAPTNYFDCRGQGKISIPGWGRGPGRSLVPAAYLKSKIAVDREVFQLQVLLWMLPRRPSLKEKRA